MKKFKAKYKGTNWRSITRNQLHRRRRSPWTQRPRCGRSAGAGPRPWCRPCGQRCAGQADVPCPLYRSPAAGRPPGHGPAGGPPPKAWSRPANWKGREVSEAVSGCDALLVMTQEGECEYERVIKRWCSCVTLCWIIILLQELWKAYESLESYRSIIQVLLMIQWASEFSLSLLV